MMFVECVRIIHMKNHTPIMFTALPDRKYAAKTATAHQETTTRLLYGMAPRPPDGGPQAFISFYQILIIILQSETLPLKVKR